MQILTNTNLEEAKLNNANLTDADLTNAKIKSANINNAIYAEPKCLKVKIVFWNIIHSESIVFFGKAYLGV